MTSTLPAAPAEIGNARRRKEDAHLITGRTRWTDNIVLPGMVHIAVLRSPVAAGDITSVDVSAAREARGVVGAWSGADFAEQGGLPCAWPITPDMKSRCTTRSPSARSSTPARSSPWWPPGARPRRSTRSSRSPSSTRLPTRCWT